MKNQTINQFNSANLKAIREDIDSALAEVEQKYGITLKLKGISYDSTTFTSKVEATIGTGLDAYKNEWSSAINTGYGTLYNLSLDDFGQKLSLDGKEYTLVGIRTKARTKPFLIMDENGKTFIFGVKTKSIREYFC